MEKVEWLAAWRMILFLGAVSPVVADDGITAAGAGDFLNSLGVCMHIGQGIDRPLQSATALAYAGLRNTRDDGNPRHVQDWIAVHEQASVKVVLTGSGPSDNADGTNSATVDLGDTHRSVKLYDPATGTAPTQVLTDAESVSLTLSDHPVIIEME